MKIITAPNPILNTKCEPVAGVSVSKVADAFELMHNHPSAAGLAAPQLGFIERWFITWWSELFVNPVVKLHGQMFDSVEGCLSIPGKLFRVRRATQVRVQGKLYTGPRCSRDPTQKRPPGRHPAPSRWS